MTYTVQIDDLNTGGFLTAKFATRRAALRFIGSWIYSNHAAIRWEIRKTA